MDRYAVIMAGGAGSRLWPLSREGKPKQFVSIDGNKSMLEQTIERICQVVPAENCFVITNKKLFELTKETVRELMPASNIILEPMRKNTAACIAYAALLLKKKYGSGLLSFVPADGHVKDHAGYKTALEQAYDTAQTHSGLVIIGIAPGYPSTGYGYMQIDKDLKNHASRVYGFVEKPDAATAEKMIVSGGYLWNCGILLGNMDVIIENIRMHLPDHFNKIDGVLSHTDEPDSDAQQISTAYAQLNDISFDFGVLEKSDCIYAVKGYFDWDDIGSLDALSQTLEPDKDGNAVKGNCFCIDTHHSFIYSEDVFAAAIGIDNLIVACTKDAVIVCPKEKAQYIKLFVEELKKNGFEKYV